LLLQNPTKISSRQAISDQPRQHSKADEQKHKSTGEKGVYCAHSTVTMQFTFSVLFLAFAMFTSAQDTTAVATTSGFNIAPLSSML
jgi:cell division protein FtsL